MRQHIPIAAVHPNQLAKHLDSKVIEERWARVWREACIYDYDPARPRCETFVVDTPPPTVSGALHIGHVFSYTHPDLIVRYRRMRGMNVFYPMGWDDNGLPTERRVQNFYHVRCATDMAYDAELRLTEATPEQRMKPPRPISRANFIELCHELTARDERVFMTLFQRLGLSVDWRQGYATIDDRCRRLAQRSFLQLLERKLVYQSVLPTMWDVDFQTAVAQAEVEERVVASAYHYLRFGIRGGQGDFVVATTRPELLPACVGVAAHPEDARYAALFGREAVTPLFHAPVPIFASRLVDPTKGAGIVMVCTFGDQTDVVWWREHDLELRQIIGKNGRLLPVRFGEPPFPSDAPERANACYTALVGKSVNQARSVIVELLSSSASAPAIVVRPPQPVEHAVKFYEKGDRALELIIARQWFVRLMDQKSALLQRGSEISWHPSYMRERYRAWTENLSNDWCISRQRYFGVPIPLWYALDDAAAPIWDRPIRPDEDRLPVDPMTDVPPGFAESARGRPGGFIGERDVFDTWFTSSLTPDIATELAGTTLMPADLRPQSHDIIRTWAFYTIAKSELHHARKPWNHVMISGWILDPDRKKMSKSKGNVITPLHLLDEHGVDAVRYWAARARLGADTAFDPSLFKVGRRLVTKLFNAAKFVLGHEGASGPVTYELDRAFLFELSALCRTVTSGFDAFDYADALEKTESFFWNRFTDTYVELTKPRVWQMEDGEQPQRASALAALRLGLDVLLRLFAPVLPYITEEVWSWRFARERGCRSIHSARWPGEHDFVGVSAPKRPDVLALAGSCLRAINRAKSEAGASTGRILDSLVIAGNRATLAAASAVLDDAARAARCRAYELREDTEIEDGMFMATEPRFADRAPG